MGIGVTVTLSTILQAFCQSWGSWLHHLFVNGWWQPHSQFVNGVKNFEGHSHTRSLSMICHSHTLKLSTPFFQFSYGWQPYKTTVNDFLLSQLYHQFVNDWIYSKAVWLNCQRSSNSHIVELSTVLDATAVWSNCQLLSWSTAHRCTTLLSMNFIIIS